MRKNVSAYPVEEMTKEKLSKVKATKNPRKGD